MEKIRLFFYMKQSKIERKLKKQSSTVTGAGRFMEQLKSLLEQSMSDGMYQVVISNPRAKDGIQKVKIRPVMLKEELCYQESCFEGTKVFHRNKSGQELIADVINWIKTDFRQLEIRTKEWQATVLVGRKGNVKIKRKNVQSSVVPMLGHNRKKNYILDENTPVGFLQDLGVQAAEGKIIKSKFDKFRQINRFLEFIEDILPHLPKDRTVRIVDFGCGKSYLTFAMYYYLKVLKQYDVEIIGLDLKQDVISMCNQLSEKYGYEKLHFYQGDIKSFQGAQQIDMVVTLHACDTATDYALDKAIRWNAGVILSVPCCQHEMNEQIQCKALENIFSYGLIRERTAALFTDALRGELLESQGYDTQILEFIDMEHTPKNIMLRCIKRSRGEEDQAERQYRLTKREQIRELTEFLQVQPKLAELLQEY